ncbi:S53 family peptidase [Mycobacterium sp. CVI_P3]|uniref:S53 family peptidase n=1 Tax=Mycobacterium pinniadriaticum TaxID=2994102 RepID=A0ABT3S8N2_9MYCO|nr:S53 family peptidase [Mycobacterium pinniadriaticum]MCX2929427.1 S53 family peptidase [Mycobacterium pinniadriaticum]MCX2935851.1 S53 family peptidase [Mycobacterium pinniadriaticum]
MGRRMELRRRRGLRLTSLLVTLVVAMSIFTADRPTPAQPYNLIPGPFARLLAQAVDLGPARAERVQLTAELREPAEPAALRTWAGSHGLTVRWRDGDAWAVLEGAADAVARALDVAVHDYRRTNGRVFYASRQQPAVPQQLELEVSELGRILGYTPYHEGTPPSPPLDVPNGGLIPTELLSAYNVNPLSSAGYIGSGQTVAVFTFDGVDQRDLDKFSDWFTLPKINLEVMGTMPAQRRGEATMDVELVHAIAPSAKIVLVNARPTAEGDGPYVKLGKLMEDVDARYPGAVWSFSIGWGCDRLLTRADLAPVRSALARAHRNGTTAFVASGDLAGLECKGGHDWSDPPSPDDFGVDVLASLPEVTGVGGTTLSTDAHGRWLAEQGWYDVPLTQGSGGGASVLFARPSWQEAGQRSGPRDKRLVPDIAAVADPFTGVKFVFDGQIRIGGGTSQAAPIWAGLAAVMNQFLTARGLAQLGDLNPLLYEIANGSQVPAFRDIYLGANAVTPVVPGYDMITGLGTPNVDNLMKAVLVLKSLRR